MKSCVLVFGLACTVFVLIPFLFDNGQCIRSCNVKFGGLGTYRAKEGFKEISGFWTLKDRLLLVNRCFCEQKEENNKYVELGDIPRLNKEEELGYPYIWKDPSVCGEDAKVYPNADSAKLAGVSPLHCGPHCGEVCSCSISKQKTNIVSSHLLFSAARSMIFRDIEKLGRTLQK